jgi:hypothetical protein
VREPSLDMVACADLLIGLGERVSLSSAQIARATGADPKVVVGWLSRKAAPSGIHAQKAVEMFSFVSEMARKRRAREPGRMA